MKSIWNTNESNMASLHYPIWAIHWHLLDELLGELLDWLGYNELVTLGSTYKRCGKPMISRKRNMIYKLLQMVDFPHRTVSLHQGNGFLTQLITGGPPLCWFMGTAEGSIIQRCLAHISLKPLLEMRLMTYVWWPVYTWLVFHISIIEYD
jgi:hypothetical protein